MIKSENIMKVIKTLESLPENCKTDGNLLVMGECHIHDCRSPHCHGGWYAIAARPEIYNGQWRIGQYTDGVELLARELGFYDFDALPTFMYNHPEIWGNETGHYMFGNDMAFRSAKRPNGSECLQDIIDHWHDVYDRVVALEKPQYVDITKDLAKLPISETPDKILQHDTVN